MPLDLPINDVKDYVGDLLDQMGEDCTVDGIPTKIMFSDLQRAFTNLQENMKDAVLPYEVIVQRGSKIITLKDNKLSIVFNNPNDDLVSKSVRVLICNAVVDITETQEVYDETTGEVVAQIPFEKPQLDGFIERVTAREKQYDVGLLHETVLRFITFADADIALDDIVLFKNKYYRVVDIDDITEGLLIVQLSYIRR